MNSWFAILIFAVFHSVDSTTPEHVQEMLENGFVGGTIFKESSLSRTYADDASLWISPDALSQIAAATKCKSLGGKLVSILTQRHDDAVRSFLFEYKSYLFSSRIWTSGMYDAGQWYWYGVNQYANMLNKVKPYCQRNPNYGIFIQPGLSTYEWCTALSNCRYQYICVV